MILRRSSEADISEVTKTTTSDSTPTSLATDGSQQLKGLLIVEDDEEVVLSMKQAVCGSSSPVDKRSIELSDELLLALFSKLFR